MSPTINPYCLNEPIPGEAWIVTGMTRPARSRLRLYRALIPSAYKLPADPMVAFSMVRLDVPGDPSARAKDPTQGYMEGTVAIRVRQGSEDGWYPLATPVNDSSQYSSGRDVGIPKYLDSLTINHNHRNGAWTGTATVASRPRLTYERVSWRPGTQCAADPGLLSTLRRFTLEGFPQFTLVRPWDEHDPSAFPERVKFTVSPLAPNQRLPAPVLGTTVAYVNGAAGPRSLPLWRELVADTPRGGPRHVLARKWSRARHF